MSCIFLIFKRKKYCFLLFFQKAYCLCLKGTRQVGMLSEATGILAQLVFDFKKCGCVFVLLPLTSQVFLVIIPLIGGLKKSKCSFY